MKSVFPEPYQELMAMAYYLVSQGGALSLSSSWGKSHMPDLAASLSSQRISELLATVSTDQKQTFFAKWLKKRLENDYLCYDITSVSSYSEQNEYIKNSSGR
jgi:hypothetical protein